MYPSYDMNPITINHMQRERLAANIERVDHSTNLGLRIGATAIVIFVAIAIVI